MRIGNHVSLEDEIRKSLQSLKAGIKDSQRLKQELTELDLKIKKFRANVRKSIASSSGRKKSKG